MNANAFDAVMEKWQLTSLVVGVLKGGEVTTTALGTRSKETGAAAGTDTVYGVGSISKVFTATLAMVLAERGMLDLDAPVASYFPAFPLAGSGVRERLTMRHLLTHRGGFEGDGFVDKGNGEEALAMFVADFSALEQFAAPGDVWSYSNNGLGLAGAVLAHVSGLSYEDAMRRHVYEPLGLARSGFGQPPVRQDTATGYDFDTDGTAVAKDPGGSTRSANPAGGLMSTVPDLLRFAQYHLGQVAGQEAHFLSEGARLEMQRTQTTVNEVEAWGIGWGKKLEGGDTWVIEHGGWMNGFRAQLTLVPEQSGAFAILTNSPLGHAAIEDLQKRLLAEHFGVASVEPPSIAIDPAHISRYLGRYQQSHMDVEFVADGAGGVLLLLKTKWHGDGSEPLRCPLVMVGMDEFLVVEGEFAGSRLEFLAAAEPGAPLRARVLHRICFKLDD